MWEKWWEKLGEGWERTCLRIEVYCCDEYRELDMDACAGCAAGGGFGSYASDCAGAEDVRGCDEVVCVPLGGYVSF